MKKNEKDNNNIECTILQNNQSMYNATEWTNITLSFLQVV